MFETLSSQIGAALVLLTCGFAFWKGDEPERIVAGAYILGWFASLLVQSELDFVSATYGIAVIDLTMLVLLGAMTWKSRKVWPIWGCACQLLIVMSHLLVFVDQRPSATSFIAIINLAGYGVMLALAVGTFWAWQERRAAGVE